MMRVSPGRSFSGSPFLTTFPLMGTPLNSPLLQPAARRVRNAQPAAERIRGLGTTGITKWTPGWSSTVVEAVGGAAVGRLQRPGQVDAVGHGADAAVAHGEQGHRIRGAAAGAADRSA